MVNHPNSFNIKKSTLLPAFYVLLVVTIIPAPVITAHPFGFYTLLNKRQPGQVIIESLRHNPARKQKHYQQEIYLKFHLRLALRNYLSASFIMVCIVGFATSLIFEAAVTSQKLSFCSIWAWVVTI